MRTAGIVGGIGPESTIQYYRQIVDLYRDRQRDDSYPPVIVNSIDMTKMLNLIGADRRQEVTEFLLDEVRKLSRAGADFGALASNTPHVVFAALQTQSPIPLISIVASACHAAQAEGLKRVALFGTRFTMQGHFYPDAFAAAEIAVVAPKPDEQSYIHDKYMTELVKGVYLSETRTRLLDIVGQMRIRESIDGVVLGGTELPLIVTAAQYQGVPLLDTTRLHVEQIVAEMLRA